MRRVPSEISPFLEDLRGDRILRKDANFVRGSMQSRANASEYWPYLYDRIVRRNPAAEPKLKRYSPDSL